MYSLFQFPRQINFCGLDWDICQIKKYKIMIVRPLFSSHKYGIVKTERSDDAGVELYCESHDKKYTL